jgi:hypothetical protein
MDKKCSESSTMDYPKLSRSSVVLRDRVRDDYGREQVVATVKGGDIILEDLHAPKDDGRWHYHEGIILPRGAVPRLADLLSSNGLGVDGSCG